MKHIHIPPNVSVSPPELIAHRGYALRYPENTLPALRAAIEAGARYLEFDVQLTADGVPVLSHDADLWRTAGLERSLVELTLGEVMEIEVNETARLGMQFSGVRIPLLGETTTLLREHPQVMAFVEIKRASLVRFGVEAVVERVVDVLKPVLGRCVIISFDRAAIEQARQVGATSIGWVLEKWSEDVRASADALKPDYIFCDYRMIPADAELWPGPWRWALYEIIEPDLALSLAAAGAELVETMAIKEMLSDRRLIRAARRA